jgi:hypothetical protein
VYLLSVEFADFATFDYHTLYPNNEIFDFFAQPWVPFVFVALYLVLSKPVINLLISLLGIKPDSKILKAGVICHSAFLAVYSGWTFINVAIILYKFYNEHGGLYGALCGSKQALWVEANMSFWITHFYISKFYEFIDTWIVLLKGKTPILLQTYHHAGVVICMWLLTVTYGSPVVVLVFLNSFIHTIMYTYYTAAAFGYSSPLKKYLTQMQLGQFLIGIGSTVPCYFIEDCMTPAGSIALVVLHVYTVVLIGLFGQFYVASYKKKPSKKE